MQKARTNQKRKQKTEIASELINTQLEEYEFPVSPTNPEFPITERRCTPDRRVGQ